jgi:hypothetical protein
VQLRLLVSAFACDPEGRSGHGAGEDQLGWNLISQLSRRDELWALSHANNRPGVERALGKRPNPSDGSPCGPSRRLLPDCFRRLALSQTGGPRRGLGAIDFGTPGPQSGQVKGY